MSIRSFFSSLLRQPTGNKHLAQLLNEIPIFSQFGTNVYASDVVQMCIDAIATECSKLQPRHIRKTADGLQTTPKSSLNRLFRIAPNELMTTRDFIEKIIWLLYMNYNCFIYPAYELFTDSTGKKTRIYTGLYPLNPTQVEFLQDASGRLFVRFSFLNSQEFTLAYNEMIHLRKKFSVSEVMGGGLNGQPDNTALLKVLEINDTVLQGLGKAIQTSLAVRAVLKINNVLDDTRQQAERTRFEAALANGESGILPIDLRGELIPITVDPKVIDRDTMKFLQEKVLFYYGVSLPILSGDFTDEQYQAFYEKTLEPLVISLGQAFSKTLFTTGELDHGNELVFYPEKLLFTNTKNRIALADILANRGALTNNQLLDLFGYPPYEGGETRYMSLNYVDVSLANEYQMTRARATGAVSAESTGGGEKDEGQA